MRKPAVTKVMSPALEFSSPIHRRTAELYRLRYPVLRTWTDDAVWSECYRQARREVLGDES